MKSLVRLLMLLSAILWYGALNAQATVTGQYAVSIKAGQTQEIAFTPSALGSLELNVRLTPRDILLVVQVIRSPSANPNYAQTNEFEDFAVTMERYSLDSVNLLENARDALETGKREKYLAGESEAGESEVDQ